jgi:hypothetical protein
MLPRALALAKRLAQVKRQHLEMDRTSPPRVARFQESPISRLARQALRPPPSLPFRTTVATGQPTIFIPAARAPRRGADGLCFDREVAGHEGHALFRHAYRLNLEGIVAKRFDSRYVSGRFDGWRKIKCPDYRR